MGKLFHLLTNLALDPNRQNVFVNAPSSLMDEVGLSEAEQTAIMSRESAKIAAFFVNELSQLAVTTSDPGPDPLPDPDPFPPSPPEEPKPDSN